MSQKFCHNCGKQMQEGWKACPFCSTSLASLGSRPQQQQQETAPVALARRSGGRYSDDDDDDETPLNITQTRLEVELVKDRPLGESIANVMSQGQVNENEKFTRQPLYQGEVDRTKVLTDFKQEAGVLHRVEIE